MWSFRNSMSKVLGLTLAILTVIQSVPGSIEPAHAAIASIVVDKSTYISGEPITLTYTGSSLKDWIGLYNYGAVPKASNPALNWKYTSSGTQPDGAMSLTRTQPGHYEAIYMQNDGYTILGRSEFNIIQLNAPTGITFINSEVDAGEVAGDVLVKSPSDQTNVTGYNLYWGGDSGKLSGQGAIASLPRTVSGDTFATYTFPANTVVPRGATKLMAYSNSSVGESISSVSMEIPGIVLPTPNVKFEVITDTHVQASATGQYSKGFDAALKDISTNGAETDGIMHIGDITDSGSQAEYATFSSIWNKYKASLPPMHFTFGNHDVRWADFKQRMTVYTANTGMDKQYYDFWLKGYHFIFLGTEKGLKDASYLSETQLNWLDETLSENESPGKPVFIFHHQPLKNTVAGANVGFNKNFYWYGVRQDRELKMILAKHPQSILFSGHTHWELGSKDTMYNAKYATMFNAASAGYLWTDNDTSKNGSQGFYVEAYDDKVLVKGRDFIAGSWVPNAQYVVSLPAQIPVVDPAQDPDLDLGNPTMQLNKTNYRPQEAIQVTYTGSLRADAFGIFPRGTIPSETSPKTPIASIKTSAVHQPDGELTFTTSLAPGSYDMIYLGETMNTELMRVPFEVVKVDKAGLTDAIAGAQVKYNTAVEGANVGEYTAGSKALLMSAIEVAQAVVDDSAAVQADVDQAASALALAVQAFEASIIPQDPSTTLMGSSSIQSGQSIEITYALNSVKKQVYAEDIKITYDPNVMEFVSANSLLSGLSIVKTVKDVPGKLRLIVASQGAGHAITGDAQLVKMTFKSKQLSKVTTTLIAVTDTTLGDEHGDESKALNSSLSIQVTPVPVGIPGDMNHDAKVSVGDLGIVAANYGKTSASPDWESVKQADSNNDGKIDIIDLAFIALKIME
ncbi:cohesin domain-containing protein [Paenibacillus aceris]|uniref:Phosphodiesterase n=1 Tax=Paenibacillus aceris TaxID=869555 RepID=A0ABS4HX05_9BACL|nr:cohesin domain-containing protein [Paenibacillus aceris]MBP1963020.1 putative phosphodiesterase [Paenibacillus aceris]NHW38443.1 hypothetical protein [Paenibacillus aceris]